MSTKVEKKPKEKPTVKKINMPNQPEQPKMTEEQAFMAYTNQQMRLLVLKVN